MRLRTILLSIGCSIPEPQGKKFRASGGSFEPPEPTPEEFVLSLCSSQVSSIAMCDVFGILFDVLCVGCLYA